MKRLLPLFLLLGACDAGSPSGDAGGDDLSRAVDLARAGDGSAFDAAAPVDLAGADLAGADLAAPDLAAAADLAGADLAAGASRYDSDGPDTVATFTANVQNGNSSFTAHVWVPGSAGPHAVVLLEPGLLQPAVAYAPYGQRLASWGVVAVMRDDPGVLVQSKSIADDLAYTALTWLPAQNADNASPLAGKVDLSRLGLAGHSRGGQASLMALEGGLSGKAKAWFGLDPVDSALTGSARGSLGTIGIPTTFLGMQITTTCSPAADNYDVLYLAAPSPSVELVGVAAAHTQVEDQAACNACNLCTPMGTADSSVVLAYAVRYLTAFFARELDGDATVGDAFQGAGAPADVAAGRVTLTSK
jgi:hypothetical protein